MQFINASVKKLVKSLSDNDFKYLTEEFDSENVKLLKQKDAYPYEDIDSLERFSEEKLPDKQCKRWKIALQKMEQLMIF